MQLPVPERRVADTDSFPVAPDGVAEWLATLDPLDTERDAREVLRGLTHSNRLHNHVDRRRAVIARFVPTLRALHERLIDTARAQPLPLTPDFARAAELADALLREEALAFRLLMADSTVPIADDARRAMRAITRRAELLLATYRRVPDALLREAHALYRFAHHHQLADQRAELHGANGQTDPVGGPTRTGPAPPASTDELYRYLLLLCLIDGQRHRARQLPLLLDWLRERVDRVALRVDTTLASTARPGVHAIELQRGGAPAPSGSVLLGDTTSLLALDVRALIALIGEELGNMVQTRASLLGADTLERQTLARLHVTLLNERRRRHGRQREDRPLDPTIGHQDICAQLRYAGTDRATRSGWRVIDSSPEGMQLWNPAAAAGSVQVGELVLVPTQDASDGLDAGTGGTRRDVSLAIIRRVQAGAGTELALGLEFLARAVMPVALHREDDPDSAPERGLVIACRIGKRSVQSVLVPPFLYQAGDRLRIAQDNRSRRVELVRCLQLNGLFSHYELGRA